MGGPAGLLSAASNLPPALPTAMEGRTTLCLVAQLSADRVRYEQFAETFSDAPPGLLPHSVVGFMRWLRERSATHTRQDRPVDFRLIKGPHPECSHLTSIERRATLRSPEFCQNR
jgi:hypothetical protein